jgi:hypothetical protein
LQQIRHQRNVIDGVDQEEVTMQYFGSVIEKLLNEDEDLRRARRRHGVRKATLQASRRAPGKTLRNAWWRRDARDEVPLPVPTAPRTWRPTVAGQHTVRSART